MDVTEVTWQIIENPNALTQHREYIKEKVLLELQQRGLKYELTVSNGPERGMSVAERLCKEGKRHFIIIGGDGSINEIINGIYNSGVNTEDVFLAIIPLGTGNDFCRTLHYPESERIGPFILDGNFKLTDVGLVETLLNGKTSAKRYFINIAGFAFDAEVIKETVGKKPKFFPSAIYLTKLIKVLFGYKPTTVTLHNEDHTYTQKIFTIAIGNAQYNGNGMRQVPQADPHDGILDVVMIKKISPLKVIWNVKNLFSGKHITLPEVKTFKAKSVEIAAKNPIYGEVEGEMLEHGNYRVSVCPTQINILSGNC